MYIIRQVAQFRRGKILDRREIWKLSNVLDDRISGITL
mgnify:FL=1